MTNLLRASLLAVWAAVPALGNNIVTADHPPINPRGWTLQFDNRPTYSESTILVNRDETETRRIVTTRQDFMALRLFVQNAMLRFSMPFVNQTVNNAGRYGWGDAVVELGPWLDRGPWRFRFLGFFKAPTGEFSTTQAVNIGSGQWDLGPSFYVTRYLDDKKIDLNLQAQYAFKAPNTDNGQRPGNDLTYAMAGARRFELGAPMRLGIEHRALFGEPNRRDGRAIGAARRTLSFGPVAQIDLSKYAKGFSIWPTMIFDLYNAGTQRTQLYYLRLNYNY